MEDSLQSLIQTSKSILILLPTKPYFDQVAAGLALYLALKETKETTIACPNQMTVEFNHLVGVDKITTQLGNKNLIIRFTDYRANEIERVSYDIENGEFRLTVIPKSGFNAPKHEQVQLEYSGVSADTVVLVGGANESHFPNLKSADFKDAKIIHIGTKALDIDPKISVLSLARPASSVSEVTAVLINQNGLKIDSDIATNLLAGIEEGSRGFKGPDVQPETFETVAQLLRNGGRRIFREELERTAFPKGAIPEEIVQEENKPGEPPKDWLEPKIYKGTSIS